MRHPPVDDLPQTGTAHEASLLSESTDIRRDGQHTTRYSVSFETVTISLDGENNEGNDEENDREFEIEFTRPDRTRDERLADLWSELREET